MRSSLIALLLSFIAALSASIAFAQSAAKSGKPVPTPDTLEAQPEDYVAPRAPAPGTPTPEALARLKAATQRTAQPAAPAAGAESGEKPRFGINSLINRMTGHGDAPSAAPRQQPPVQRAQAPAQMPENAADPDQERIEIPAFLRRQAN